MEMVVELLRALNNREMALLIWVFVACASCFYCDKIRESLVQVAKCLLGRQLVVFGTIMFAYLAGTVGLLYALGIWETNHWFVTVSWCICTAFVMLHRYMESKDQGFFWNVIKGNFKGLVFLEFLAGTYVFSLLVEMILLPLLVVLGAMITVAVHRNEDRAVIQVLTTTVGFIGLGILAYAGYMAITDFWGFTTPATLRSFCLPILLTIGFLPFIYLAALYVGYETSFLLLERFISDRDVLRYAKLRTMGACHFKLEKLRRWSEYVRSSWRFKEKREVDKAFIDFKSIVI